MTITTIAIGLVLVFVAVIVRRCYRNARPSISYRNQIECAADYPYEGDR